MTDPPFTSRALSLSVFASPQRWWLRRERPPALCDARQSVRALRTCLLLGAVGAASGWLSAALLMLNGLVRIHEEGSFWMPGAVFGAFVLVPLSRWSGRNWFAAAFAVPVSTAAYWAAIYVHLENDPPFGSRGMDSIPAGALGGMAGMVILSVWMAPLRAGSRLAWLIPAGVAAGAIGGAFTGYGLALGPITSSLAALDALMELGQLAMVFAPFQTVAAITLGARLWWLRPSTEPL